MKKILLSIMLVCLTIMTGNAQTKVRTLSPTVGLRGGYKAVELSVQIPTVSCNRLEIDGGIGGQFWNSTSVAAFTDLSLAYQWVFGMSEKWNFYIGPAAGVGYGLGKAYDTSKARRFRINLGGQAGVEYLASDHFTISLDYRPMVNFFGIDNTLHDYVSYYALALGLRYRF
jgi:opacity protein-like surface antigen